MFLEFFNLIASKHKGEICLIRNGIFFLGINEQAIFLEKCLSLKKGCFGKFVCKVGFPINSLRKNIETLEELDFSFCVFDYINDNSKVLNNEVYSFSSKKYGCIYSHKGTYIDFSNFSVNCESCVKNIDVKQYIYNLEKRVFKLECLIGKKDE